MRILVLFIALSLLSGCLLTPPPTQQSRKDFSGSSDLDSLEILIQDERDILNREQRQASQIQSLRIGMQRNRVKRNLGLPNQVEVAGNPKHGIERWIYERRIPTQDGYFSEKKVIYFEGGQVVGWESE